MEIRISIPEAQVGGTYATAVRTSSSREVVTFDFLAPADPSVSDAFTVVSRVRLAPGALERFYLELGEVLRAQREQERG